MTHSINWPAAAMRFVVVAAAIGLVGFMVLSGSRAAFSGTTSNTGNSFAAGTVTIEDNDAASAMYSVTGLKPNDTETRCILVTYTGDLDANVRLYAENLTSTTGPAPNLDTYLDVVIERGNLTGSPTFPNCDAGFVAAETVYDSTNPGASDGDLDTFATNHSNFANGAGAWNGVSQNDAQVYRFTVTLQDDNGAKAEDAQVDFTWEAQNT